MTEIEIPKFFHHSELVEFVLTECSGIKYDYNHNKRELTITKQNTFNIERVYFVHELLKKYFQIVDEQTGVVGNYQIQV